MWEEGSGPGKKPCSTACFSKEARDFLRSASLPAEDRVGEDSAFQEAPCTSMGFPHYYCMGIHSPPTHQGYKIRVGIFSAWHILMLFPCRRGFLQKGTRVQFLILIFLTLSGGKCAKPLEAHGAAQAQLRIQFSLPNLCKRDRESPSDPRLSAGLAGKGGEIPFTCKLSNFALEISMNMKHLLPRDHISSITF